MILIIKQDSTEISAAKVRRPKFSSHRGRTWDHTPITIDGREVKAFLDTTWGERFYFEWNNHWYAISMTAILDPWIIKEYTIKKKVVA